MKSVYTETDGSFFVKFELHGRWQGLDENLRIQFQNYAIDYSTNEDTYVISFYCDTETDMEVINNFRQHIEESDFEKYSPPLFAPQESGQWLIIIALVIAFLALVAWAISKIICYGTAKLHC